jgi:hypothetical protein
MSTPALDVTIEVTGPVPRGVPGGALLVDRRDGPGTLKVDVTESRDPGALMHKTKWRNHEAHRRLRRERGGGTELAADPVQAYLRNTKLRGQRKRPEDSAVGL